MADDIVLPGVGVAVGLSRTGTNPVSVDRRITQNGEVLFGLAVVDVLTECLAQQVSNLAGLELLDGLLLSLAFHIGAIDTAGVGVFANLVQIVAVADTTVVVNIARHAAGIIAAADSADIIAVADGDATVGNIAHHAAGILGSFD